jgi:hypothetical protein
MKFSDERTAWNEMGSQASNGTGERGKAAMKAIKVLVISAAATVAAATFLSPPAEAKGCIKGAIVGGVAGHYAGHHGKLGAAVGCIVGHHRANKAARTSGQGGSNQNMNQNTNQNQR